MDKSLTSTRSQRWLARLSFALAGLAIVVLAVFGGLKSLAMLAVAVAAFRQETGAEWTAASTVDGQASSVRGDKAITRDGGEA